MKKIHIGWLLTLLLAALSSQAHEVLRIGVPNSAYPPYILVNDDNIANGGLLFDLLQHGLAELDMQLELVLLPGQRAKQMMILGQLDGQMFSQNWTDSISQYLWLDTGLVLEDVLLYRSDLPFVPHNSSSLAGAEVVTHIGYVYPTLEPHFRTTNTRRLDKYTEEEMLQSLVQAPAESTRMVVMERRVWDWYQPQVRLKQGLELRVSPMAVDCVRLQIQLVDTPKIRLLLPKLQQRMQHHVERDRCPRRE